MGAIPRQFTISFPTGNVLTMWKVRLLSICFYMPETSVNLGQPGKLRCI